MKNKTRLDLLLNTKSCMNSCFRSSHPEVFLVKGVLKICSKFTGEHSCWSVISIKLLCNFIEITLRQGCSPVNMLHIFKTPFPRNTSGWLLLKNEFFKNSSHETGISSIYTTLCPEPSCPTDYVDETGHLINEKKRKRSFIIWAKT